jgi:acid phosphatase class B
VVVKKWDYEAELWEQEKLVRKKMLDNIFVNLAGFSIMKQKKGAVKRMDRHWKKLARSKSDEILFGTGRKCRKLEKTKLLFPNWKHRMTKRCRNIIYKQVTHKDEQNTSPTKIGNILKSHNYELALGQSSDSANNSKEGSNSCSESYTSESTDSQLSPGQRKKILAMKKDKCVRENKNKGENKCDPVVHPW